MREILFYLISIILIYPALSQAQGISVDEIAIRGGDNLDHDYLFTQITTGHGDVFDVPAIEADIQRLRQMSGVLNATYAIDSTDAKNYKVFYDIEQRGTLKPILGIGGIKDNFWFAAGISEYNLNGRNQVLEAYYLNNDNRHNAKVYFQNEKIRGGNWGFAIDAVRLASLEPLYFVESVVDYDYTNHALGGSVIHWLGRNTVLQGGVTFFIEDYIKRGTNLSELPGPDQLTQNKALFKVLLKQNKIKYDYFYRGGHSSEFILQNVQTFGEKTQFVSLSYELKKFFRPSYRGNIALRFKGAIATNNDSPFAPFVLDSNFNIRGVGNRVDRGTAQLVLNAEYRHAFHQRGAWAVQGVAFADGGSWRSPGAPLSQLWKLEEVIFYYGAGVRIIYNKHIETTLRVDYGFDAINPGRGGFVIGIGQFF